jgi:hypothetical protein
LQKCYYHYLNLVSLLADRKDKGRFSSAIIGLPDHRSFKTGHGKIDGCPEIVQKKRVQVHVNHDDRLLTSWYALDRRG